jgi:hypothetical protein
VELLPEQFAKLPLPCLVCGKPVEKGSWFLVAALARETVREGSDTEGLLLRPVHVTCVSPIPLRRPNG